MTMKKFISNRFGFILICFLLLILGPIACLLDFCEHAYKEGVPNARVDIKDEVRLHLLLLRNKWRMTTWFGFEEEK